MTLIFLCVFIAYFLVMKNKVSFGSYHEMNISPSGEAVWLYWKAVPFDEKNIVQVTYQWYRSADEKDKGIAIPYETRKSYKTENFTDKGIYYYYCLVTARIADGSDRSAKKLTRKVPFSVAYTGLPTVYLETLKKSAIKSKEDWTEKANISIKGASNTDWNFDKVAIKIRGRGNTTWGSPNNRMHSNSTESKKSWECLNINAGF